MSDLSHIPDKAVTAASEAGNVAYLEGGTDAECWRAGLAAALPVLNTAQTDDLTGFFIANDDGYPELRYSASDDGNDEGEHVCFAEAGTALSELVRAARKHAAPLRGEQGE